MGALAAATLCPSSWHQYIPPPHLSHPSPHRRFGSVALPRAAPPVRAFRLDFDQMAKKARETWRSANGGFEQLVYESRIAAQRLDSRYSISTRLQEAFLSASVRIRDLDRQLGVSVRARSLSVDVARNWPRYKREINGFLETPIGKAFTTIFIIWFVLSGWLFNILIFSTWVLPFAVPLILGGIGNNLIIQGTCPSCKKQFVGYRNQVVRCSNCKNIVWQSREDFSKGQRGGPFSASDKDVIDIEIDDK